MTAAPSNEPAVFLVAYTIEGEPYAVAFSSRDRAEMFRSLIGGDAVFIETAVDRYAVPGEE